jgi:hypothetical protein
MSEGADTCIDFRFLGFGRVARRPPASAQVDPVVEGVRTAMQAWAWTLKLCPSNGVPSDLGKRRAQRGRSDPIASPFYSALSPMTQKLHSLC